MRSRHGVRSDRSMATVFLTHNECRDLRSSCRATTVAVRYQFGVATVAAVQDELRKVSGSGGIKNLACHVQTKDRRLSFGQNMAKHRPGDDSCRWLAHAQISIRFVNRFLSPDLPPHNVRIVELYLDPAKIPRTRTAKTADTRSLGSSTSMGGDRQSSNATAGYERIRVVGKGAFGSAILYRRKDDDSLVIIKEINMHDLSANERQFALNEVNLLSRLDHPCIVSYFDSFEEDGILMIEMEYADGGTLAQHLSRCDSFLPEQDITELMRQMLCAVTYLHRNSVLHRDLKTANIFLTRENNVKIGDFGISRIMGTDTIQKGAETVVGTPYYISPEMCEGKTYNEKSDIWALGCILYEITCLQKAFEGENLPALVNRIMKGNAAAAARREAERGKGHGGEWIFLSHFRKKSKLTSMLEAIRGGGSLRRRQPEPLPSMTSSSIRSVLYTFSPSSVSLSGVDGTPPKIKVSQISISSSHAVLIVSPDFTVYSWGGNAHGQVFLADRGTLLVCGDRKMSGNGKEAEDQLEPQLVTSILRMDIVDVSAGEDHVVAVAKDGTLRLPSKPLVIGARCGANASALMMDDGSIMACGSNRYNKLNLAQRLGFFGHHRSPHSSEDILTPTRVPAFPERVVDVSLGANHTGGKLVLESGLVYMFGMNVHGELGNGGLLPSPVGSNVPVRALFNKGVVMLSCGDGFTLAATVENELFFWGSKGVLPSRPAITLEDIDLTASYTNTRVVKLKAPPTAKQSKWSALKRKSDAEAAMDVVEQIIPIPSLVLRLDNSADPGQSIRLAHLSAASKRVYVTIDTSVPMKINTIARRRTRITRQHSAPNLSEDTEVLQTWLRKEFDQAERIPIPGYLANSTASLRASHQALTLNESVKLHAEIETLKKQMAEQSYRTHGHAEQMSALQRKLAELQTRQSILRQSGGLSSPPPEYTSPAVSATGSTPKVVYNSFFPEQQAAAEQKVESRACCIL
ncbi:nekl-1 [Pristionchus pacificus]|uniref:non-specific serine/threonine protein kinase n=1 Tax=Pristionchus pacificus TaxID=54126 RepID=A0A2A6BU67_PRIPA|nr:nekl-1 [Pristionchus pacificus]|eukprot:PDM69445.1 nekl-1 [Pristionchus pacificus]